jgi:hypothetical protein
LNFAVYADFSALAVFLILGSVLDFESKKVNQKIIQSLKYYVGFTLLAFIVRQLLIKYQMNPYYYGFIEGSIFNIGWVIFFYTFFKNYESKIYRYEKNYTYHYQSALFSSVFGLYVPMLVLEIQVILPCLAT